MRWLTFITALILTSCTPTYEHTLVLDNNSAWNLEVITYSADPLFSDTLAVNRGAEVVLFHSQAEEYAGLNCLDKIDSAKVEVQFADFHGDLMDSSQWTTETVDRAYKNLTFCTFEFNQENVN